MTNFQLYRLAVDCYWFSLPNMLEASVFLSPWVWWKRRSEQDKITSHILSDFLNFRRTLRSTDLVKIVLTCKQRWLIFSYGLFFFLLNICWRSKALRLNRKIKQISIWFVFEEEKWYRSVSLLQCVPWLCFCFNTDSRAIGIFLFLLCYLNGGDIFIVLPFWCWPNVPPNFYNVYTRADSGLVSRRPRRL